MNNEFFSESRLVYKVKGPEGPKGPRTPESAEAPLEFSKSDVESPEGRAKIFIAAAKKYLELRDKTDKKSKKLAKKLREDLDSAMGLPGNFEEMITTKLATTAQYWMTRGEKYEAYHAKKLHDNLIRIRGAKEKKEKVTESPEVRESLDEFTDNYNSLMTLLERFMTSDDPKIQEKARDAARYKAMVEQDVMDPSVLAVLKDLTVEKIEAESDKMQEIISRELPTEEEGMPQHLAEAVEDAGRSKALKRFKATLDKRMKRLTVNKKNPYTNETIDLGNMNRNPNLTALRDRLAELDAKALAAKTPDEIDAARQEVRKLTTKENIDEAMRLDWAVAIVRYACQEVMYSVNDETSPKEFQRLLADEFSKFANKEPLKSVPNGTSWDYGFQGVNFRVTKETGNRFVADNLQVQDYAKDRYAALLPEKPEEKVAQKPKVKDEKVEEKENVPSTPEAKISPELRQALIKQADEADNRPNKDKNLLTVRFTVDGDTYMVYKTGGGKRKAKYRVTRGV